MSDNVQTGVGTFKTREVQTGVQAQETIALAGVGALALVPSPNGAAAVGLGTPPAGFSGVRLYMAAGESVSFTIAGSLPSSAPVSFTASYASTGPNWDEDLALGMGMFITGIVGSPKFRFR